MIHACAIHKTMDVEASTDVVADELCQVVAEWMQECTNGAYVFHSESRLVRKSTKALCQGQMTLGELGVIHNEIFYLF